MNGAHQDDNEFRCDGHRRNKNQTPFVITQAKMLTEIRLAFFYISYSLRTISPVNMQPVTRPYK